MGLYDSYYASKAGKSGTLAFNAAGGASVRVETVSNIGARVSLLIFSDVDVYLRQGGSTVTASTSEFLLLANTFWPVLVENINDVWIAAIAVGASTGTLKITCVSDLNTQPNSA